ncbi:hypothetical protein CCHR01_18889 [Colletotrichum chrysophilum]|uniref:Uncharacterized protein n=1 Tax=Colletotrichum chrysophilum TaxID=1836956 RepID=A0AAD9EB10_9PEZI|nr:hypothetical protein K456DRAFT_51276 [Colletotrichum gloeosporioides 23]KAK1838486.1 hypothetical protein CCHR01_18889 [Colletotrichum chrysophilum]
MQSARLLGRLRPLIFLLPVLLPTLPTSTFAFSLSTRTLGIQTLIITLQKETT